MLSTSNARPTPSRQDVWASASGQLRRRYVHGAGAVTAMGAAS